MKILKGLKREFGYIRTGLDVIADAFIGMAGYVEPGETIIWPQYRDIMPPQQTREAWLKQDMQLHPAPVKRSCLKIVYIAGPYRASTEWGVKQNIHAAELAAMHVWQLGGVALCPHLNTAFFGGACPDETWLAGDLELLGRCDAVYAMVDWRQSKGATAEVELAESLGLPVFFQRNVTSERELAVFLRGE